MANQTEEQIADKKQEGDYWCNFCGFKTTSLDEYLAHSCKEVLEAKGIDTAPTDAKECR